MLGFCCRNTKMWCCKFSLSCVLVPKVLIVEIFLSSRGRREEWRVNCLFGGIVTVGARILYSQEG